MKRSLSIRLSQSSHQQRRRARRTRLLLEPLEDRTVPATITVTTTVDSLAPTDGLVSLREAIAAVNLGNDTDDPDIRAENPGTFGPLDTINFNISGTGVQTIHVGAGGQPGVDVTGSPSNQVNTGAPLPAILRPVLINGYTQSGAAANTLANAENAALRIDLDGTSAGTLASGLTLGLGSGGSTIKGLAINHFTQQGIEVESDNNTIAGNFVGVNAAGTMALPNQADGIRVLNATGRLGERPRRHPRRGEQLRHAHDGE
jgi:hypothetical protein